MSNQIVAGTIILSDANGEKKFLVQKEANEFKFITTGVKENLTSLASILQELKTEVQVDVTTLGLVELTNACVEDKKIPLYVFEMEAETEKIPIINESYNWETPATLRKILTQFSISGVPIFQ